jgi:hypothetical protein
MAPIAQQAQLGVLHAARGRRVFRDAVLALLLFGVIALTTATVPAVASAASGSATLTVLSGEELQLNVSVTEECSECFWYGQASVYPASAECPSTWTATAWGWVQNGGVRTGPGTVSETERINRFGLEGPLVVCIYVNANVDELVGRSGPFDPKPAPAPPPPPPPPPPPQTPAPPPTPPAPPAAVTVHFGGSYQFHINHPTVVIEVICNVDCSGRFHERVSVSKHGRSIRLPVLESPPVSFSIANASETDEVVTGRYSGRALRNLAWYVRRYGQVRFDIYVTVRDSHGNSASDHRVLFMLPTHPSQRRTAPTPARPPEQHEPSSGVEGVGSYSHAEDGRFCSEHQCIGNFTSEPGTVAECEDGTYSHAGRIQGACSHHGGVRRD